MAVIETRGLGKSYGTLRALDGLDLTVDRGDIFGFLGPNGAGKTTTLKVLTGQIEPDSGTATVLGTDPAVEPIETRRRVGVLPEQESPPSFLTPREYFEFVGDVRGMDETTLAERVETWVDRLGFAEKLDTLNADLSRGQQQKVMLTQAFLHEPAVAFIDEPLANLDPIVQEQVKRFLRTYAADGNAVFISTHHVEVAAELCTRIGILDRGKLVAEHEGDAFDDAEALLDSFLDHVHAGARDQGVEKDGDQGVEEDGDQGVEEDGDANAGAEAGATEDR